jgi:uncharacterized membrane protein YphA (DoxX/SURF4 family)
MEVVIMKDEKLTAIYWPLRLTYGLVPLLAGLDKYFGVLADWESYLSPTSASLLPVAPSTFLHVVGVVEIVVGLAVLSGATRLGALAASGWLFVISIDLVLGGFFDVAVRDLAMAVGAYTLAGVAALRGEVLVPHLGSVAAHPAHAHSG